MRLLVVGAVVVAGVSAWSYVGARDLTFDDRVAAQKAIEQVYWNHRIWPGENACAKPPLSAVVSNDAIRAKVDDYVRASDALGALYGGAITAAQLQAEMTRMADKTRDPGLLLELFAALGNDPFLIAECLARPVLADRMIRNGYARDDRFHGELGRQAAAALAGATSADSMKLMGAQYSEVTWTLSADGSDVRIPSANEGTVVALAEDEWNAKVRNLAALFASAPSGGCTSPVDGTYGLPLDTISPLQETNTGFSATAVIESGPDHVTTATVSWPKEPFDAWWGRQRVAFYNAWEVPASSYTLVFPREGGCVRDSWSPIRSGVPEARAFHTAVWTGVEMIVWSGGLGEYLQTGGRYNPATDTWVPTSLGANVPPGRIYHTAVWTGTEMIVWGGYSVASPAVTRYNTGGRYNPTTDTWAPTRVDATTPAPRYLHTAVWTGTEMIVWGGTNDASTLGTGGSYDPVTDTWRPTSTGADSPGPRRNHTAVWTGSEMIIWGWSSNAGKRYDPTTDSWRSMSTGPGVPTARTNHTAVWTGSEMIVWGGLVGSTYTNTGGRYNPISDAWTPTSTGANVPTAAQGVTAVWAQHEMIVWGGPNGASARYAPLTDSWQPMNSSQGAPSARAEHTAVWTGSEMIVWGGRAPATLAPAITGGRYDPVTDRWTPTSTGAEIPTPRWNHTGVWTGTEMIVWGGGEDTPAVNTGGRYVPATDAWSPTSVGAGVPDPRREHVAVWTGREMIVWGGGVPNQGFVGSGGRYDPTSDSWRATTSIAAPFGRFGPAAVWTGREMIVWGGYDYLHQSTYTNTGGRYDPSLDRWRPTLVGASLPRARLYHSAVWTGDEMLVWGGTTTPNTVGDRYDPTTDTWRAMGNGSGVPSFRSGHSAVWTGSGMIVFGGAANNVYMNSGARYEPTTNSWSPIDAGTGVPSGRQMHTAAWTGAEMVVWGGTNTPSAATQLATGGRYDPLTNRWSPTSTGHYAPLGHVLHTAVWTGREMLVWGGRLAPTSSGAYCACPDGRLVYRDADGDGFGDPAVALPRCDGSIPPGYVAEDTDCDDHNASVNPVATEVCDGVDDNCDGVVNEGGSVLCDDANPCTNDTCNGASGCEHTSNASPCDDADACTMGDTCGAGICNPGTPIVCDDNSACTDDTCDPATGCVHTNNTEPCDDGSACTTGDTCDGGLCRPGTPVVCNDGNVCTDDSCDPSSGCFYTNNTEPCDDQSACTTADMCGGGSCHGGPAPNCHDNNPCTDDSCNPSSGCVHANNTNPCDDGSACTSGDTCGGGACHPGGPTNCDDGQCCTIDSCNPATGCVHVANTAPPAFTTQPSFGNTILWPPQHGYADFGVAATGAAASSSCGIASIQFASCSSSQPENGTGTGDGNSVRDCVYEPGALHLRAERDGACSPIGRIYTTTVVAVDVCGNTTTSNPFDIGVWHDRGHAPATSTIVHGSGNQDDTRNGTNGTYGTDCGLGSGNVNGTTMDHSDADPEMEISQNTAVSVGDLRLDTASGGSVKLTWTDPTLLASIHVTRYHVYRLDPRTLFWTRVAEVSKTITMYLDPVLNDGSSWQYKVTAVIK